MKRVAVIDYGMCNLDSVKRAVEECGGDPVVTSDHGTIADSTHLVLPGVGAFTEAMTHLHERELVPLLREMALVRRVPFLGICLGMQLMASRGDEGGDTAGLDLVGGVCTRLVPTEETPRIPHVGWNEVVPTRPSPLFEGIAPGRDFYFVHSYHFACASPGDELARTPYCGGFTSAVASGTTLFGVQFHPEKSQRAGFQLLRNFLSV
jgi:glutamine amidotransferase